MDTLKGIPEHIEAEFGEAIVARDDCLMSLGTTPGLGPPDLCWLQKCPKASFSGAKGEPQGYYHYVLGRDVSSSAAVAAYFALLNSRIEPVGFLQGLWLSSEWTIQRGFYCCYDPFNRMDIRCELCIPGGVVCGAVDAAGNLHDVTPQMWRQAQVSKLGVLAAACSNGLTSKRMSGCGCTLCWADFGRAGCNLLAQCSAANADALQSNSLAIVCSIC